MAVQFRDIIQKMTAMPDRAVRLELPPIRLSQNELPWEPAEPVLKAMSEALTQLNRYPDYHRTAARQAIADAHGVPLEWIAADNGSGSLLHGLVRLVTEPGTTVAYGWPAFEAYPVAIGLAGGTPVPVEVQDSGAMDLDAIQKSITENTKLVFLCNPNNPSGGFVSYEELEKFISQVPDNVLIVIDEAYREFVTLEDPEATIALVKNHKNVAIVRTLSKAYGLAGVRAGYVIAHPEVSLGLRRSTVGFALNSVAEAAIIAAFTLEAQKICTERIESVIKERDEFIAALTERGIEHLPSQSNFVFIKGDAVDIAARFENQGVLARPFPAQGGVRLTIGTEAETKAALATLESFETRVKTA